MKADAYDLRKVLGFDRQLFAPLFQRPYVWTKEKQWEPLWVDIKAMADNLFNGKENVKPHFLGAVVLDQMRVPVGRPDARSIIDGQQRLTTLQIFLSAFRDVCKIYPENEKISKAVEQLIFNDDPLAETEIDRFKVWPTNLDRLAYQAILTGGTPAVVREAIHTNGIDTNNKIFQAYLYFHNAVSEWVGSNNDKVLEKLKSLLHIFREKIKLVVIDMDDEDDAQVIFETLNARGTPLLPSDLVKNFLFHKAQEKNINLDQLYEKYWKAFDDDDNFWRGEVRFGRLMRPRIDLFLQHYLTLMKNEEVPASNLFREFQNIFEEHNQKGIEWQLKLLWQHARNFKNFLSMPYDTREGAFFKKLNIMDTTTIFPFLLGLYQILYEDKNAKIDKIKILDAIESFLIRRLICKLTTKNYNRLFLDLLNELKNEEDFDHSSVRRFFLKHTAESSRWPTDENFLNSFLFTPVYIALTRPRLRMILESLDHGMKNSKTENYYLKSNLTVEHFMPQHWEEHWPLAEKVENKSAEEQLEAIQTRNQFIHTFGNLTLLTQSLNPAISNGPFDRKKQEILKHSAINLNRFLLNTNEWDFFNILQRSVKLFKIAILIWPHPDGSDEKVEGLINKILED